MISVKTYPHICENRWILQFGADDEDEAFEYIHYQTIDFDCNILDDPLLKISISEPKPTVTRVWLRSNMFMYTVVWPLENQ